METGGTYLEWVMQLIWQALDGGILKRQGELVRTV
jgi:hypothetical protein